MPQTVAQREQPPTVVPRERLIVLVEVGNVGERGGQAVLVRRTQARADCLLYLTQTAREGELLFVVDGLAAEHQHGVFVHAFVDRCHIGGSKGLGYIDAAHLGCETGADLAKADGHGWALPRMLFSILGPSQPLVTIAPRSWLRARPAPVATRRCDRTSPRCRRTACG